MRCKCSPKAAQSDPCRSVRRCFVCGKMFHPGCQCAPSARCRSGCEQPTVTSKDEYERCDPPADLKCKEELEDFELHGGECGPEHQSDPLVMDERDPEPERIEHNTPAEEPELPFLHQEEREEAVMGEAALDSPAQFFSLLPEDLPGDPH